MSWKDFLIESFNELKEVKIIRPKYAEEKYAYYVTLFDTVNHPTSFLKMNIRNKIVVCDKGIKKQFHWDDICWKLITCISGKIKLDVVDAIDTSYTFGIKESYILSEINKCQILIPPGYANSYETIKNSIISYHIFYNVDDFDTIKQNIYS